jgi:hypothetical protein
MDDYHGESGLRRDYSPSTFDSPEAFLRRCNDIVSLGVDLGRMGIVMLSCLRPH